MKPMSQGGGRTAFAFFRRTALRERCPKSNGRGMICSAPAVMFDAAKLLIEAAGRVRQHSVNLAGLRGEIGPRHHLAAIVARDLIEQALELGDVAVDRLRELAIGAIFAADLLERALTLHRIELAREHIALAALVAVPELGGGVVVDHARDVDCQRVERLDGVTLGPSCVRRRVACRFVVLRSAGEQVGEPAAACWGRRRGRAERGGVSAARRWWRRRGRWQRRRSKSAAKPPAKSAAEVARARWLGARAAVR